MIKNLNNCSHLSLPDSFGQSSASVPPLWKRKTAFTLIELLVVIAIISMLAAFLLPVLAKVRAKAKYARWQTYSHTLEADPELVAYYNFQEGSGSTIYNRTSGLDMRGYDQEALNGTTQGGAEALWTTTNGRWPGKGAIEFDQSNAYVDCGNDSSLNITGAITIEVWVKPNLTQSNIATLIEKCNPSTSGLRIYFTGNNLVWSVGTSGGAVYQSEANFLVNYENKWTHVVVMWTGTHQEIYINGTQTQSQSRTGVDLGTGTLYIAYNSPQNRFFNGPIDEVAIYSSVLSVEEIRDHYKMGKP